MGERGIALTDNIVNLLLVFEAVVFQIYIQNPIKIISEPYLIKKKNKIFIFFEYKKNGFWNISYKLIDSKVFKIEKK